MLGLIVIVVLVSIIMLVVATLPEDTEVKETYLDEQNVQSMLNSIMNSMTVCEAPVYEVIQDCYLDDDNCPDSCEVAQSHMDTMLKMTYGEQNIEYSLKVEDSEKIDTVRSIHCTEFMEQTGSSIYTIPLDQGVVSVTLNLCKG